jgi:hypothetical protein
MIDPGHQISRPQNGHGRSDISLTRIYLPFAMVVSFGAFLGVAGYTVGGVMTSIERDKTETGARLEAIEREVTAIKGILASRSISPPPPNCHIK